jgi:hypothetical protein
MSDIIKRTFEALDRLAAPPGTPGEGKAAQVAIARLTAAHEAPVPLQAPTDTDDPIIGLRIRLDRAADRCPPCCDDADVGTINSAVGPQVPACRYAYCNRHRGWMKLDAAAALRRLLTAGLLGPVAADAVRSFSQSRRTRSSSAARTRPWAWSTFTSHA